MSNSLIRVSRRAMACEFEVCFPAAKCESGTELAMEALDLVEAIEGRLSYFRPDSEISRINRLAGETPVEVEPDLFDLLRLAVQLSEATGGAYDITSAPLWEVWGFARRAAAIPSKTQLAEAQSCVGSRLLELNPDERTIRFRKAGVKINAGSIGKGYALDVCAEYLLAAGMTDFLLHGGQSSVLARGSPEPAGEADVVPSLRRSGAEPAPLPRTACKQAVAQDDARVPESWEVGLADPRRPGSRLAVVKLFNRALGTSGGQFQSFRHQGRRYGHILDPRSGWPAEGVLSVTVVAPAAALADALSTAFYVLGPQASLEYCRARPEIGMMMLCAGDHGKTAEIHRMGLDCEQLTL